MAKRKNAEYNTLSSVVFGAIEDIQGSKNLFRHYLHFAIKAYREYMWDINQEVRTVELDVNLAKKAQTPDDYLKWCKVGKRNGDMIAIFVNDDDIPRIYDKNANGNEKEHTPVYGWRDLPVSDSDIYELYNYQTSGHQDPGRMFGKKVIDNYTGYFRINDNEIQLNVRMDWPTGQKLYLEYIADGLNPNQNTYVHPFAKEMIATYIHWQIRKNNPKGFSQAAIRQAKEDYIEELELLNTRMTEWDIDGIKEAMLQGYSLTPNTL